jgi:hypothetical protein
VTIPKEKTMAHITPTPGRIVYFRPGANDGIGNGSAPLAAIVAAVNEDGTLNLGVFSTNVDFERRLNVPLVQQGDVNVPTGGYAHWMDYQLGQAAKTEQAQMVADAAIAAANLAVAVATDVVTENTQENPQ